MRRALALILLAACSKGEPPVSQPSVTPAIATSPDAALVIASIDAASSEPCPVDKASLGPGLTVERWHVTGATPTVGEPCIDVVRADLSVHYDLKILGGDRKPATAWQKKHDLVAVINAGMFHESGAAVGLVIPKDGPALGLENKKFGGYFAFDPVGPKFPSVYMQSRDCDNGLDLDIVKTNYESIVQSYRLLDCKGGAIAWQDPKHYSAAAIGVDKKGRVVFIHARAAFTMRELSTALASHDLVGAIFLEGGPEASLVVHGKDGTLERVGSYETNFVENDDNHAYWDLPNVIALVKH